MKTYIVGFSEATVRAPRFIEAESLQVIDGGKKVYFRDSIGFPVSVYSEGAGIVVSDQVPWRLRLGWFGGRHRELSERLVDPK